MKKMTFILCLLSAMLLLPACKSTPKDEGIGKNNTNAARYQCPMKCEGDKSYDSAGKCPKCGMDTKEMK